MKDSELVYSTGSGKICCGCGKPVTECVCKELARKTVVSGDGTVRVSRETKGRKGKGVTVVTGIPLAAAALEQLGKELRQRCGCGGTVKDGTIEIQGDKRDLLVEDLQARGYRVKRSGG